MTKQQKQEMAEASAKAKVKVSKQSIEPKPKKAETVAAKPKKAETVAAKPKKAETVKDAAATIPVAPTPSEAEPAASTVAKPASEVEPAALAPAVKPKKASLKGISKETIKATKKLLKKKPAHTPGAPPVTPLTKLLARHGFKYVKSASADDTTIAHGYVHEDGAGALFIHSDVSPDISASWVIKHKDGTEMKGRTALELAAALVPPPSKALPAHVVKALAQLRKVTTTTFAERKEAQKEGTPLPSKTTYRLADLAGDANYKARLQLLKTLRQTDKVLVKDSGVNNLIKEFYAALSIPEGSAAARASAFETRAVEIYKAEQRSANAVKTVEQAVIKETLRKTAPERVVLDNKPLLPMAKKLSPNQQQHKDATDKAALAVELTTKGVAVEGISEDVKAKIALKRRQEEYTPLAAPRPDAELYVNLEDVCLLENPDNGIAMLCLEKPNSQGAICVYNNGSRVAAGVLETEDLIKFRRLVSEDLVRDVNQLLHPITSGVIVTDLAHRHLTAVLDACKESIDMANETAVKTKKFEAPVKTATKAAKKAAAAETKPAAKKAAAKPETAARGRKSKFDDAAKITILVKENPYRAGTRAYASYEAIKKSKTVGAFKALCTGDDTATDYAPKFTYLAWSMEPHGNTPALVSVG